MASDSLCMTEAAKLLAVMPHDFLIFTRTQGRLFRRRWTEGYRGDQSRPDTGLLDDRLTTTTDSDGTEAIPLQLPIIAKDLFKLAQAPMASGGIRRSAMGQIPGQTALCGKMGSR